MAALLQVANGNPLGRWNGAPAHAAKFRKDERGRERIQIVPRADDFDALARLQPGLRFMFKPIATRGLREQRLKHYEHDARAVVQVKHAIWPLNRDGAGHAIACFPLLRLPRRFGDGHKGALEESSRPGLDDANRVHRGRVKTKRRRSAIRVEEGKGYAARFDLGVKPVVRERDGIGRDC